MVYVRDILSISRPDTPFSKSNNPLCDVTFKNLAPRYQAQDLAVYLIVQEPYTIRRIYE